MKKFIILLVIIVANNLFANRPKIGLVFSGGGARGISQIGALKVLEEAGIFPDYIAGTSVGSIIGGLYAIGYSPVQIEEIMTSQNWPQMFIDKISIKNISIEEKEDFNKYISEFPITQNRLNPPKGLVDGQMISILLSRLTSPVLNIDNFDDFYIPFRCIATDIETGETVVIKDGYLPDALQASVSIPSIFKPVEIDNKTLVDGGMSRNLPIIDVIEMGADIVIAIDTGSELFGKDKLNSFLKIMQQSINFRGIEKSVQSRKLADLIISPELDNYIITDFDKSAELIKIGEEATRKKYKDLLEIAKIQKRYSRKIKPIPNLEIDTLYINKIKYKGLKTVSKNLVIGKFKINEKSLVTFDELENGIKRLYGSKYFTRVSYKLLPRNRGFDLKIRVEESLKRGLKFSLYYDQDTNSAIHLNTTVRNFLMEGTRLKVKGKISESPSFDISYFIHTGWKPGFGITPYFRYQNYKVPVYGEKSLESKFNHHDTKIGFRFQTVYFHSMTFGIDFNYNESHSRSILSSQDMSFDVKMNQHSIFFDYDTKDNTYFPKVGSTVSLNYSDFRNVSTKNQE
ncbi:MAG: patatin-like phospholipase family protein, partial [Candidatus Cloacimonadota bacterium]|nr:patatin-like phospholipase family protein [Candidatus Cloacimonadota bacterium]